ncbi:hypothetical protein U3516DRAFT_747386 [Neocallimastix sp. 'constans']
MKLEKIQQEIGFICSEYNTIKSQITKDTNNLMKKYYKIEEMKFYNIRKSKFNNLPIPILNIFVDGTFYIAPKFCYQLFITRTHIKDLNTNNYGNNTIITPKKNFIMIPKKVYLI